MPDRVPRLSDHLGYWLRQISNHVSLEFTRKLARRGVTVAEWALLRTLFGKAPRAPSLVAEDMGLTRGAVTKLADRLIIKGLVVRSANPADGRAQTLRLSAKGAAFVPQLAALAELNDRECFSHLSEIDRRALHRILRRTVARLALTSIPLNETTIE